MRKEAERDGRQRQGEREVSEFASGFIEPEGRDGPTWQKRYVFRGRSLWDRTVGGQPVWIGVVD